jgi:hypothetical protein
VDRPINSCAKEDNITVSWVYMAQHNIPLDWTASLNTLQREIDGALGDLIQVCSAAAKQRLYEEQIENFRFGLMRLNLEKAEQLGEEAPERAARTCYLNVIGKYITFLDKMIAAQRITKDGIVMDRTITVDELSAFIIGYVDAKVAEVSKDRKLTNPKKIGNFPKASDYALNTSLAYFELRRGLEHHGDLLEKDLIIPVQRVAIFIDNEEVKTLPCPLNKGQAVGVKLVGEERRYAQGKAVVLSPQDAHDLAFTIRAVLAPEVFRAALF